MAQTMPKMLTPMKKKCGKSVPFWEIPTEICKISQDLHYTMVKPFIVRRFVVDLTLIVICKDHHDINSAMPENSELVHPTLNNIKMNSYKVHNKFDEHKNYKNMK